MTGEDERVERVDVDPRLPWDDAPAGEPAPDEDVAGVPAADQPAPHEATAGGAPSALDVPGGPEPPPSTVQPVPVGPEPPPSTVQAVPVGPGRPAPPAPTPTTPSPASLSEARLARVHLRVGMFGLARAEL